MGLSRKRQRELTKLKRQAEDLVNDQREVLEHASQVVRDASRQAANYAREEVAPRVRDTYEHNVRPAVKQGVAATRSAAHAGKDKITDDVVPALASALGVAAATLDAGKKRAQVVASRTGLVEAPKTSSGPGKYILIGLAVVAVAGVAYAAWQTLRADDSLWVEDEPEEELDELEQV